LTRRVAGRRVGGATRPPTAAGAAGLGLLALVNAGIVVWLWWRAAGAGDLDGTAALLAEVSRVSGLLGAYLVLVALLLLARLPALERLVGFDRLTVWHRWVGRSCVTLLCLHAALITVGYAVADELSVPAEVSRLISGYPGVITAIAGLALLIAVAATSAVIVRRRLRY
jgi:predicted ferric reductase